MPSPQQVRQTKAQILRDMIRLQNAPVSDSESVDDVLTSIKGETSRLGLPESDGVWFYRLMQRNGWKFNGIPILDWRWTVQNWHSHSFFPSQR